MFITSAGVLSVLHALPQLILKRPSVIALYAADAARARK